MLRGVEVLEELERDLRFERVQTVADRILQPSLRVRQVDGDPLRLLDHAEHTTVSLEPLFVERMQVDQRAAGDEEPVDVAQGVHDALTDDSSRRPGEQREVEARGGRVNVLRSADGERDTFREAPRR